MASNVELTCSLCTNIQRVKFTFSDYLKHLRLFHVHQANFRVTCGISGCQRSYTNIRKFQNHVYDVTRVIAPWIAPSFLRWKVH